MHNIQQVIIMLCTGASIWAFAGTKYKRLGFIFGLAAAPFWLGATFSAGQWGMFLLSIWVTGNNIRGLYNYK